MCSELQKWGASYLPSGCLSFFPGPLVCQLRCLLSLLSPFLLLSAHFRLHPMVPNLRLYPLWSIYPSNARCPPQSQSLGELEDLPLSCGDRKPSLNAYTHPEPSAWKSTHVVGGRICIYSSKKNQTNRQVRQAFSFRKTMTLRKAGRTSTHR